MLRLVRRPDAVVDGSAMIVRGSVERDRRPGSGADRRAGRTDGVVFRTLTDERGNFALAAPSPCGRSRRRSGAGAGNGDAAIRFVGTGLPRPAASPGLEDLRTTVLPKEVIAMTRTVHSLAEEDAR